VSLGLAAFFHGETTEEGKSVLWESSH
jgi:hypothetical protein